MHRHAALLRGINVGKAKRVAMADLRAIVEELGGRDVATLLNSGNVVFSLATPAPVAFGARLEKALEAKTGVSARAIVLSAAEVAGIVAKRPFGKVADNPSRLLVVVPADPGALALLKPVVKQDWGAEQLALGGRAAYLWCPEGVLDSKALPAATKALKNELTARNWATFEKLRDLCAS